MSLYAWTCCPAFAEAFFVVVVFQQFCSVKLMRCQLKYLQSSVLLMVYLTLLAANPPQSHISSFNLQLLKHADMIKAQNLIQIILQTLTLNDTK